MNKRSIVAIIAAILAGLALILLGLPWRKKEVSKMPKNNAASPPAVPALDKVAPTHTETAAFAMG